MQAVDTAVEVEKTGLTGKVYLDARGIDQPAQRGSVENYGDYDQSLRDLEKLLKEHTKLEVVLDNQQELFQPGQCPQAALYCGWYSLAQYVDAFDWQPGAVAFHIASAEAKSLRWQGQGLLVQASVGGRRVRDLGTGLRAVFDRLSASA